MSENCKKCNPENGECSYCPHSSVGLINIKERGGPRKIKDLPDIDLYDNQDNNIFGEYD